MSDFNICFVVTCLVVCLGQWQGHMDNGIEARHRGNDTGARAIAQGYGHKAIAQSKDMREWNHG